VICFKCKLEYICSNYCNITKECYCFDCWVKHLEKEYGTKLAIDTLISTTYACKWKDNNLNAIVTAWSL
jgi:hypothetical protein